jgi:hypothetical protein
VTHHRDRLRAALRFIAAAREEGALRERVRALDPARGLGPAVELAAEHGFELDLDALREAHRIDWTLRRAAQTAARAPTTVAVVNRASSST